MILISAFTYDNSGGAIQIDYKSIAGYIGKYYKTVNLEYRTVDGGMSSGSGQVSGEGVWPVGGNGGTITAGYPKYPSGGAHSGIDIGAPEGTPVYAAYGGTVIEARYVYTQNVSNNEDNKFGNCVRIQAPDGKIYIYGHLSKVNVKVGDVISAGQQIGNVGTTGRSSGNHLHFEVRDKNNKTLNPYPYLPPKP